MGKLEGSVNQQSSSISTEDRNKRQLKRIKELEQQLELANTKLAANKLTEEDHKLLEKLYATDTISKVWDFHEVFGHSLGQEIPEDDILQLRINLIFEELEELAEAGGRAGYDALAKCSKAFLAKYKKDKRVTLEYNKKEVLDALCDLQYVIDGTTISCKLDTVFPYAFGIVHKSNMSKAMTTPEEVKLTVDYYEKNNVETYLEYKDVDNTKYCVIKRKSDDKILKSISYTPADFTELLNPLHEEE